MAWGRKQPDLSVGSNISEIIAARRAETYAMLQKHGLTLSDEPNQAEIDAAQAAMLRAGVSLHDLSVDDILRGM